jgi:peptidoglycan/xylan/chitin deacetylase (PgdA/CDA1 family)
MISERLWNVLPGKLLSVIHDYKQVFFLLMPHMHVRQNFFRDHRALGNYVIFRMDDIQDYWLQAAQLSLMDLFVKRNQNLSLGLIMNRIGNDTKLIDKLKEGSSKKLFELCLHGWDHLDYTKLNEEEQEHSLRKANEKMATIFGHPSSVFISPYGLFDKSAIKAMKNIGLRVLSANGSAEYNFDKNKSTFLARGGMNLIKENQAAYNNTIYHLPTTLPFKLYLKGKRIEIPFENALNCINKNVARYGYAVVVFHPQDFVQIDRDGNFTDILQEKDIKKVSQLIDALLSKNLRTMSFSEIVKPNKFY